MANRCSILHQSGKLSNRAVKARTLLANCTLCPRHCQVNRLKGETGMCGTGAKARIASYAPHFGEEQPLVGTRGSGTIFLTSCNLRCCFCQNYDISHHADAGKEVDDHEFAAIMLDLQDKGCHNINFVTPSHVTPQILSALIIALEGGLHLPIVYNCSGYERVSTLELLEEVVDIYMPDFKFWSAESSSRYAAAQDYPRQARASLRCMHDQVGDLHMDATGLATGGLLIRHLLMPGMLDQTEAILRFIAEELSPETYVNIMDQYRPCGTARRFPELDRPITADEYNQTLELAKAIGLQRLDQRDLSTLFKRLLF